MSLGYWDEDVFIEEYEDLEAYDDLDEDDILYEPEIPESWCIP